MSRRFNFNTSAALWRHVYSGDKSTLTDQSTTYEGFFQPIDADQNTVALGIVSQAYQFVTDGDADIVASDMLVIDSVQYRVRGVRRNQMKRQDFITCIMELSENE
jgi:hypothetical protein